ncbi:DUF3883 domain-containing protein [Pelagibacterium nitratireducens]|uniref:DUF3883 domain-containing protein n=1 Tax=Pelagibacterium nitratireducens TaxID=1046114 RepID=A0ABZ2I8W3_9HYPH
MEANANRLASDLGGSTELGQPAAALRRKLHDQLENAVDAVTKGLGTYESLRNLSEVIGGEYGDRVVFELIQNAHDAHRGGHDGRILLRLVVRGKAEGDLYVANGGTGFDWDNVKAIRNVGVSSKTVGEGIGNKGLGFRSVETLTNDPRIYSQTRARPNEVFDGFCFRFAGPDEVLAEVSGLARADVALEVAQTLPRYLASVPILDQPVDVTAFAQEGFATVVHVPISTEVALATARKQVSGLLGAEAPLLLFLDRLSEVKVEIVEGGTVQRKILTREVKERLQPNGGGGSEYEIVEILPAGERYLVARRSVDRERLLAAVELSIPQEPQLARWRDWRGEPKVAVAVALDRLEACPGRVYNFLPMAAEMPSPIAGHVDAPFYASIDRRRANFELPLNAFLLDVLAETAVIAASELKPFSAYLGRGPVFDLAAWDPADAKRLASAWRTLDVHWSKSACIPAAGGEAWTSLAAAWLWNETGYRLFRARRLVKAGVDHLADPNLGPFRLHRLAELIRATGRSAEPSGDTLAEWAQLVAAALLQEKASSKTWGTFYEEIRRALNGVHVLRILKGKFVLKGRDGKLHAPPTAGSGDRAIYIRQDGVSRRRDRERAPLPPNSLARKLAIFDENVLLKPEVVSDFVKAGLVRRYDALELLEGLPQLFGDYPAPGRRADALQWAFNVWRAEGDKAEKALKRIDLHVETRGGWRPAIWSFFSAAWTSDGRKLATYLAEAASWSADCRRAADALLVDEPAWAPRYDAGRREWIAFLKVVGVRDGLPLIADDIAPQAGTPGNLWSGFLHNVAPQVGRDASWVKLHNTFRLKNPMTIYQRRGELWRLPGQLEHEQLPSEARERLADLILVMLKQENQDWLRWRLGRYDRWEGEWNEVRPHTPAGSFVLTAAWVQTDSSDEEFEVLNKLWATSNSIVRVPRYVRRPRERIADVIQGDQRLTKLLIGGDTGLRDWALDAEAGQRLAELAEGSRKLESRDRASFRKTYERAWSLAVEAKVELPPSLPLTVWQGAGMEVVVGNRATPPRLFVAAEAQRPEARAVIAAGLPLLELGREEDVDPALAMLNASGGFDAVRVEGGEVVVYVDGEPFVPNLGDPLLAADGLEWLSEAALLANEVLGRELERAISMAAVDDRLRRIRLKLCGTLSLRVGDADGYEPLRFYAYPDERMPTLVIADTVELDWSSLAEAAPHLASLLDRRMRSLQRLLPLLAVRSGGGHPRIRPADGAFARALDCRPELVRELLESKGADYELLLRRLPPIVACLTDEAIGRELERVLGDAVTRPRAVAELENISSHLPMSGSQLVDMVISIRDLAELRRRLGLEFGRFNHILLSFNQQPLSNEPELRRLFETWKDDLRPTIVDRIRRHFFEDYKKGHPLDRYASLRSLDFAEFPTEWILEREEVTRDEVAQLLDKWLNRTVGTDLDMALEPLAMVRSKNGKMLRIFLDEAAPIVTAWLIRNGAVDEVWGGGVQAVIKVLEQKGVLDFEPIEANGELPLLAAAGLWPRAMPASLDLGRLGLTSDDLASEKRKKEEQKEAAARQRRSFTFAGADLDTATIDFADQLVQIAEAAMEDEEWLRRSRRRFKLAEMPPGSSSSGPSGAGGGQRKRTERMSDDIKAAMGFAGEIVAARFLAAKHGVRFDDACWVSRNRELVLRDGEFGDDGLGFDFRVRTKEVEWRYEVKSSLDESFEFEFTQNEMRVAAECAADGSRRYRILYVPYVNDPTRWRVMELSNPMSEAGRVLFRTVGAGATRMRFDPTG